MPKRCDASYETQGLVSFQPTDSYLKPFDFHDLELKVESGKQICLPLDDTSILLQQRVRKPSLIQKLKAKLVKSERADRQPPQGFGENFDMTLDPSDLLRYSAEKVRASLGSDAPSSGHGDYERRSSLTSLLCNIYNRTERARNKSSSDFVESDNGTEYSTTSDPAEIRGRFQAETLNEWRLRNKDVDELDVIVDHLRASISHVTSQLVRHLKRRDRLRRKITDRCDLITAYVQAISPKRSQDARLKFSIDPPSGDTGFVQWHDAMRMVARLPEGIPQDFRRRLWLSLANHHFETRKMAWADVERHCFSDIVNPDDEELGQQILKDLHRTGSSLFCGDYAEENQAVLKRVLLAYARWNKTVGYCQGFNMLAALILGVMLGNEADSLKVMIFLIEGVLPQGYFDDNLRGLSVDMAVFRELLRLRIPELASHLDRLQHDGVDSQCGTTYEPPLTNVFTMQWFLTLFSTCLPKDAVLRVWDLVFLEGNEVLLRAALALWDILTDRILAVQSADEFYSIMGVLAREMLEFGAVDTSNFLKTIIDVAPFPFPGLLELRDKYTYNITPWGHSVVSVAKKGLRLIYSDDDDSDSEVKEVTVAAAFGFGAHKSIRHRRNSSTLSVHSSSSSKEEDKRNLDVASLTKQYQKLRERQKQAQIIWTDATKKLKDGAQKIAPPPMNHLVISEVTRRSLNNNAKMNADSPLILPSHMKHVRPQPATRRLPCPEKKRIEKEKIRNRSLARTLSNESSSSGSTELCDKDQRLSDLDSPNRSPLRPCSASASPHLVKSSIDDIMKENSEILNRLRRRNSSGSMDSKPFNPFPVDRNQQKLGVLKQNGTVDPK